MATIKSKLRDLPKTSCQNLDLIRDIQQESGEMPLDLVLDIVVDNDEGCRIAARNEIARYVFEYQENLDFEQQVNFYYAKMETLADYAKELEGKRSSFQEKIKARSGKQFTGVNARDKRTIAKIDTKLNYLYEMVFYLQDYWVFLNTEYHLKKDDNQEVINFGVGMTVGVAGILTMYAAWTLSRGRKLLGKDTKFKHAGKKMAKKSFTSWAKAFARLASRTGFRTSLRATGRSALRITTRRVVTRATGLATARVTGITASNNLKNRGEKVAKSKAPGVSPKTRSLLVITHEDEYYLSPVQVFAESQLELDKTQQGDTVRSIESYVDHQDAKFFYGLLGSVFGGFIVAEGAEALATKYGLYRLLQTPGVGVGKAGLYLSGFKPTSAFLRAGLTATLFVGSQLVSFGKWLTHAGKTVATYGSRFGLAGLIGGVVAGVIIDTWIQDWMDEKAKEDVMEQIVGYYSLAKEKDNTPYQTKMYVSRLTSALLQWAGFAAFPLIGAQEALGRGVIKDQVCNAYKTPLNDDYYYWYQIKRHSANAALYHQKGQMSQYNRNLSRFWGETERRAQYSESLFTKYDAVLEDVVKNETESAQGILDGINAMLKHIERIKVDTISEELQQIYLFRDSIVAALNPGQLTAEAKRIADDQVKDLMKIRKSGDRKAHAKFLERGFGCYQPFKKYDFSNHRTELDEQIQKDLSEWGVKNPSTN